MPMRSHVYPLFTVNVYNVTTGRAWSFYRQTQAQANCLVTSYSEAYPRDNDYLIFVHADTR